MKPVSTPDAPPAIGPYSHAIEANGFIFVSGQVGKNAKGELAGGIKEQTKQACENIKAILEAGGSSVAKVVKTTVYLKDMNDFAAMNEVYAVYFSHKPARATVQVARLPGDVLVEIDAIAETK